MIYESVKTLHILSAAVLFGTGMGIAFFQFMAWRSDNLVVFAVVARLTVIADWVFTAVAVIAQPLTGIWLMLRAGYPWDSPWLLWSYAMYVIAGVFWVPVVWMQVRIARLAAQARDSGQALPAEVRRLMWAWFCCGWPAFTAVVTAYWLMVAKPG